MTKDNFRYDTMTHLVNKFSGLGTAGVDGSASTNYGPTIPLDRNETDKLFRQSWACERVCEYLPRMMTRRWGHLTLAGNQEDTSNLIAQVENFTYPLRKLYREGQILANKDGGSVAIRLVDDGMEPEDPINFNRVKSVSYSRIYERWEITPKATALLDDPSSPEFYELITEKQGVITLHRDRVMRFRGKYTSPSVLKSQGWEDSILMVFVDPLMKYLSAHSHVAAATKNFEVMVHLIDNLFDKIETPEGEAKVFSRLAINDQFMSVLRTFALDRQQEELKLVSRQFSNLDNILEKLKEEMVAASGLTRPQLIQEHPSGLAATGQSERLAQADQVQSLQEEKWGDLIREDLTLFFAQIGYKTQNWSWEWDSLFQLTPEEEASKRESLARADSSYLAAAVISPEEVRESRFRGLDFGDDINLIDGDIEGNSSEETEEPNEEKEPDTVTLGGIEYAKVLEE